MQQPLSPWETIQKFIDGWSLAEFIWVVIAILGVFLFHRIATRRKYKKQASWIMVLFWIIALTGWFFAMYMVFWLKIVSGGFWSIFSLFLSAILLVITTFLLTRKTLIWEKIVSGVIIAVIGYGAVASFGSGAEPLGYSIIMGLLFGLILGLIIANVRDMNDQLSKSLDDEIEKEQIKKDKEEITEWKRKKSDKI